MGAKGPKLIAVAVAGVLHWLLGAGWFTLFKTQWLAGMGTTSAQIMAASAGRPAWLPHAITLVANFVMAYVLGWLIVATGAQSVMRGLKVAAIVWAGFVASSWATEYAFEGRSVEIFGINAGYPLVGLLIMGVVLGAWKK
jgi:hypothetical protein